MIDVNYKTFNDREIKFDLRGRYLCVDSVSLICIMYVKATNELPDKIFIGVEAMHDFLNTLRSHITTNTIHIGNNMYPTMLTSVGYMTIVPIIRPGPNFIMMGQDKDYARYTMDKIFEEEVLTI